MCRYKVAEVREALEVVQPEPTNFPELITQNIRDNVLFVEDMRVTLKRLGERDSERRSFAYT